ncbi:hypothetical protein SETIT_2G046400v2 [Setaria italica]|uniref:Uncharacterized protein n=1 Tax=Setaria italica TaxID=4555 RepID=A0A368PVG5_SETIT|nr:hypothetical protein SETIT_2G046400v2 [Setaria italica]
MFSEITPFFHHALPSPVSVATRRARFRHCSPLPSPPDAPLPSRTRRAAGRPETIPFAGAPGASPRHFGSLWCLQRLLIRHNGLVYRTLPCSTYFRTPTMKTKGMH